ncbi:MAG: hypothetical protein ACXV4B_04290, partial [Halobacteriota archaeon]
MPHCHAPFYMRRLQYSLAMPSGLIINSVKDVLAAALGILDSAQKEIVWVIPASLNTLSLNYGGVEKIKTFIQMGGLSRGVVQISPANVTEIQMFLDAGEDIRHSDEEHEVFMFVGDKQQSISSLNIGVEEFTLDTPVTAFWSESPALCGVSPHLIRERMVSGTSCRRADKGALGAGLAR